MKIAPPSGPYLRITLDQKEKVVEALNANGIKHWVSAFAVSIDDGPAMTSVWLHQLSDPAQVQAILDGLEKGARP